MLIEANSALGKTNPLLNLMRHQSFIDKCFLYAKDLYKPKYQYPIKKREEVRPKHSYDSKAFIEYSNDF